MIRVVDDVEQRLKRHRAVGDERTPEQARQRIQHENSEQHPQHEHDTRDQRIALHEGAGGRGVSHKGRSGESRERERKRIAAFAAPT